MSLQDEILTDIAKRMQVDIDKYIIDDVIRDGLMVKGWTKTPNIPRVHPSEIAEWIHQNATGDYKLVHGQWWFEKGADAMHFIIRWA